MTMISPVAFNKSEKKHAPFEETLRNCCYHYPNDCVLTSHAEKSDMEEMELIKMRLHLNNLLKQRNSKHLIVMKRKIFEVLHKRVDAFAPSTLRDTIVLLKTNHEELTALEWALEMSKLFAKAEKYELFVPIVQLMLRPTIYDSAQDVEMAMIMSSSAGNDGTNTKGLSSAASVYSENPVEDNMSSKASSTGLTSIENKNQSPLHRRWQAIVEKEFRKPSVVEEELELLHKLQMAAEDKNNPYVNILQAIDNIEKKQQESSSSSSSSSSSNFEKVDAKDQDKGSSPLKSRTTIFIESQEIDRYSVPSGGTRGNLGDGNNSGASGTNSATYLLQSLTKKAHRMYLDALLQTGNIAQFFIVAIRLMNKLQGFDFGKEINEWIATSAFNQFKLYLDESLDGVYVRPTFSERETKKETDKEHDKEKKEEEVLKLRMEGLLSLVQLCTTLTDMPVFLQNLMPKYLNNFKQDLRFSFTAMTNRGNKSLAKEYALDLTRKITAMTQNKLLASAHFQTEIDALNKEFSQFTS
ncbi:hypothetical protein RFI_12301 [Reticulomyxa filosa]|uniref:Uncharacterized protein n=1 Tax=Reticulomyxa filosa TaxID=46433 RepID=X6NGJ4_RETFI|nr:hypothetical protein RFI_12301 [Reticulomyxa filosa]|eukprot:ETO24854.1 hypothetical protein RFI_12301 [Reticulomyxa filosa]